ncbi:MAG: ribose-5-phosphate isomerase RpiA [Pseudomonadota bacterium]
MDKDLGKKNAAEEAARYVEDGMTVGIGTGSTAAFFIDCLKDRIAQGWRLRGVPTSEDSRIKAEHAGVEIIVPDETTRIDIAIDGTDEADPALNLIKGGGGALLREKIVAAAAERFIVIADKSKRVATLGAFALPIEIEPFGWSLTVRAIRDRLSDLKFPSAELVLRAQNSAPILSDGGHFIVDCALGRIDGPSALDAAMRDIPGVIETGLFCGLADIAIFGDEDGVSIAEPSKF